MDANGIVSGPDFEGTMRLFDRFQTIYSNPMDRWLAAAALLLCLSTWAVFSSSRESPSSSAAKETPTPGSPDLWIPEGHVLVPLQLENAASLENILGSFGIVDVYRLRGSPGQIGQLLGAAVKLIRSPEDPQQWSVLVPRHEAPRWMPDGSGFFAVVQNRERPLKDLKKEQKNQASNRRWNVQFFERSP